MRIFLDTNVLFSAFYSSHGAPARILENFNKGSLGIVVSRQVILEAFDAIAETCPEALSKLKELLANTPPEVMTTPTLDEVNRWTSLIHFEDAAILAAAINSGADYLVTGDKDFFKNPEIARKSNLRIVTPAQFIELFQQQGPQYNPS